MNHESFPPLSDDDQRFFEECGGRPSMRLVIDNGEDQPYAASWTRPFVLIGRGKECDIRLRHPDVSFRHTYLQLVEGRVFGCDLASRTGTQFPSGRKHRDWIEFGESVTIGPCTVTLTGDEFDQVRSATEPERAEDRIDIPLEFIGSDNKSQECLINRDLTLVGKSRMCKLLLHHESVSPIHCSLVRTSSGLWLVDLLGRGGTQVNGESIRYVQLEPGHECQVGDVRFRVLDPVEAAPAAVEPAPVEPAPVEPSPARRPRAQKRPQRPAPADFGPDAITISDDDEADNSSPNLEVAAQLAALSRPEAPAPQPPAVAPSLPGGGQLSETFVSNLINQFISRQQQTFEQSQQSLIAMAQMMTTMHQNQMDLMREELERMSELRQEVSQIRDELTQMRASRQNGSSDAHAAPAPQENARRPASPPAGGEPVFDADWAPAGQPNGQMPPVRPQAPLVQSPLNQVEASDREEWLEERLAEVEELLENENASWWRKAMRHLSS